MPGSTRHPQGYELTITPAGIFIVAGTSAGAFYAGQTLIQILTQSRDKLPLLRISDWPDFAQRGVMLDIIRREFTWAADMLRHACRRGIWALDRAQEQEDTNLRQQLAQEAVHLLAEHQEIWLARDRPGGFKDSQARLEKVSGDYGDLQI